MDLISRQAAIDGKISIQRTNGVEMYSDEAVPVEYLKALPSAQPDNQVNLCDSCTYQYPDCPSKPDDVIFGNGKGNDNICACNKYRPISAQPEREKGEWIPVHPLQSDDCGAYMCSKCKTGMWEIRPSVYHYCPNCGKPMESR